MVLRRAAWNTILLLSTSLRPAFAQLSFRRADSNADGEFDISDAVNTLRVLFSGRGRIACDDAADSNDDGALDISDAVNSLAVLFLGTGAIPPPGPDGCGEDPTEDPLGCLEYSCEQGPCDEIATDFDDNTLQGWTNTENCGGGPFGGRLRPCTDGAGNPGGCIEVVDTIGGGGGLCVHAPADFTRDLRGFVAIAWDQWLSPSASFGTAIILRGLGGTEYSSDSAIVTRGTWVSRRRNLVSSEWTLIEGTGAETFEEVLSGISAIMVQMDVVPSIGVLESRVDNFRLIPSEGSECN